MKISGRIILGVIALLLLLWFVLQTDTAQNFIVKKLTQRLSKDLHTEIRIKHVSISFFNKLNLEQMLVRDQKKDTLLYAGALKVRITDWFFLHKNIDLKYIGLQNAVVKMNRRDSVWNFQFLSDYFSSAPSKTKKKKSGIILDLKKVDLENVHFEKNDMWSGEKMTASVDGLYADADKIDFSKSIFKLHSLFLQKPSFAIEDFHGLKPKGAPKPPSKMYFNKGDILVTSDTVHITNGTFCNFHPLKGRQVYPYFDGRHMVFSNLNAAFKNFSFNKDTIQAAINISTKERSGFVLKRLKGDFRLTPQQLRVAHLDLRTNKSVLSDYYAMSFHDFSDDMGDYENKIFMDGVIKNGVVSTDDIAYFAPALKTWKKMVHLGGHFRGTVNNFKTENLFMRTDAHTFISGNLAMRGLTDIDTAHIKFDNLHIQTTYAEAKPIIPVLKKIHNPDFEALGVMQYKGDFDGTIHNFRTNGNLSSALGAIYNQSHFEFAANEKPKYSGHIISRHFNLGRFVHSSVVGYMSFDGTFSGRSFELKDASSTLQGYFSELEVNKYTYHGVKVNGAIQKRLFTGELNINDPNISLVSNAHIDLTGSSPKFNILADVVGANLQKLKLFNSNIVLTGLFDLNFTGKNIDSYIGDAKILNATLVKDTMTLNFDSLAVTAQNDADNEKSLNISSNEFNIGVQGKYNILDLPKSFQSFLHQYFPSIIAKPSATPRNQKFLVDVSTRNFDKYAAFFLPAVQGLDSAVLTGGINTLDSNYFYVHANIPNLKIKHYKIEGADIEGKGNWSTLTLGGKVGKIYTNDSFWFPNTTFNIVSKQDFSTVKLLTKANNTLNDAQLNADVQTLADGVKINFQPSSFVLNNKKWNLEQKGEVVIRKNYTSAQNVRFSQGLQQLELETIEGQNDLRVKLSNISMGDFMPLVVKNPKMEGVANGIVYMRDFFGPFSIDANIDASQFRLNDDSIGLVRIHGIFDQKSKKISYDIQSDNKNYVFNIKGKYDVSDSASSHPLDAEIALSDARIFILNDLLGGVFSEVKGQSEGNLHITGSFKSPAMIGMVKVHDAELTVNYTQVHYFVDTATVVFNEDNIDLGNLVLRDKYRNKATVTGKIYERALEDMSYDIHITTPKLLAIDTKVKDNPQFYGKAICKGQFGITGKAGNIFVNIVATAADSSQIYIPTYNNKSSTSNDFIVYKQYGTELKPRPKNENGQITVDLDLTANALANINVLLDQQSGDNIKAIGNGRLQIHVPAEGAMTMKGRYNIEKGSYDFNFQSLVKKPFEFVEGGNNYIEWNGSPYDANINLSANYVATHVSLNDLVSSQSSASIGGNVRGYRGDVYVIADLTGKLSHPNIKFQLDFPTGSTIKTDPDFNLFLNKLESDDNEMLKQVTYLIVFGSFAPYGEGSAATNLASVGVNTISSVITSELNKILSDVLYKLTGDKSLQFDISTSTYSSSSWYGTSATENRLDRQAVNLKVNKSLLNGNVIVTVGGDMDFNLSNTSSIQNGNFQWLPDVSVQLILSKNRKLRGIVFNRSSLDVGTSTSGALGRRNRLGASISYSTDFEKLFGTKPKKVKETKEKKVQDSDTK